MRDDGLEIFDADHHVEVVLDEKFSKLQRVNRNRSLKGLSEDL